VLRLKDIARIRAGRAELRYLQHARRQVDIGMATFLQPGANALEVAQLVRTAWPS